MKRALVSGGTKGIGLAIALKLMAAGFEITVCSRTEPVDLLNAYSTWKWFEYDALGLHSRVDGDQDVLINNIGGGGRWGAFVAEKGYSFANTTMIVWEEVWKKNVETAVSLTRCCIPWMVKHDWGRVITISSIYGKEAGGRPHFVAAKAAEIGMMKALSKDKSLVRHGVTFNTVCPGHISVEGKPDESPEVLETFPMGRMGRPGEVASLVAFLCSDEASFINGATMTCDGGESFSY